MQGININTTMLVDTESLVADVATGHNKGSSLVGPDGPMLPPNMTEEKLQDTSVTTSMGVTFNAVGLIPHSEPGTQNVADGANNTVPASTNVSTTVSDGNAPAYTAVGETRASVGGTESAVAEATARAPNPHANITLGFARDKKTQEFSNAGAGEVEHKKTNIKLSLAVLSDLVDKVQANKQGDAIANTPEPQIITPSEETHAPQSHEGATTTTETASKTPAAIQPNATPVPVAASESAAAEPPTTTQSEQTQIIAIR